MSAYSFSRRRHMLAVLAVGLAITGATFGFNGSSSVANAAGDPVVSAAGDIACPASRTVTATTCHQLATSNLLGGATNVLALGDNQSNSGSLADYRTSYDPTWGRYKSNTYPVPGNHEYSTANAAGYFQYFGSRAGTAGKGWYSTTIGSWHVVAVNSEQCALTGCGVGSEQERWLKADLAAAGKACTLVIWHHPRWASGSTNRDNTFMSSLYSDMYNANADLLLTGHNHAYERFQPMDPSGALDNTRGIQEIIVGTGGTDHAGSTTLRTGSVVRNSQTFGVLTVTLHAGSYDWKFVPEAGKTWTDSGSRRCH